MTDQQQQLDKERAQYQAQIHELNIRLKDAETALQAAQTANRRLMQDNQSLRYRLQSQWNTPDLHRDPRIRGKVKE